MTDNRREGERRLPDGWVWTHLGEVCLKPQYGWTTSAVSEGALRLLRTTDITSGDVNWDTVPFCKKEPPDKEKYLLQEGDIVVSRAGSVGFSHLVRNPKDAVFASYLIRFKPLIDQRYMALFLKSPFYWEAISEQSIGIAIPNVNATKLRQIWLPLAPLPEQRRIVAEIETQFTRLDAVVVSLERMRHTLRRYRAAVLKAACEGRLVPTEAELARAEGREYEPAERLLARILKERRARWEAEGWEKEVEKAQQKAAKAARKAAGRPLKRGEKLAREEWASLGEEVYGQYLPKNEKWKEKYKEPAAPDVEGLLELPEGWVWVTIEQISQLVTDGDHNPPKRVESGIPHFTARNIIGWTVNPEQCTYISEEDFERVSKRYTPQVGDVIITCVGTIGRTAIVPENYIFSADRNLAVVRLTPNGMKPEFLQFNLNTPMAQRAMAKASGSTAQPHLYLGDIRPFHVALCPLAEQHRIVQRVERRLSVVEALEAAVAANLRRAERLRQAILKRAFEGRLVPQDPADEPASVLLARIRERRKKGDKKGGKEGRRRKGQAKQMRLPEM